MVVVRRALRILVTMATITAPSDLGLVACRSPTELTIVVTTDFDCSDLRHAAITVGTLGDALEMQPPASSTTTCSDGRVGSLVVVPSGGADAVVGIKVVGGFGTKNAEDCAPRPGSSPPDYGKGCIVARRALRYIAHTPLTVPVVLRAACDGVPCGATTTCVGGACVPAEIDPNRCSSGTGCDECTLVKGGCQSGDAGVTGRWRPMARAPAEVDARSRHTAVWTGKEMLVYGGLNYNVNVGFYDPATDRWRADTSMSPISPRYSHVAVWSDNLPTNVLIVWSGESNGARDDGAVYDPASGWRTMAQSPLGARSAACAAWMPTTKKMFVFGGDAGGGAAADGATYDPLADKWSMLPASPLPPRDQCKALWIGDRVLVYGGYVSGTGGLSDFATFEPIAGTWSVVSDGSLPPATRVANVGVTDGARGFFWGGWSAGTQIVQGDGVLVDPVTLAVSSVPLPDASALPVAPRQFAIGWAGLGRFYVWGGAVYGEASFFADGASYASSSGWSAIAQAGAPSGRKEASVVWTGKDAIVWGGAAPLDLDDGAIFTP